MANNIVPIPQPSQPITEKGDNCNHVWWKWLSRLQLELVKYLPALGTANQLLGMNAAGTATEFKTLNGTTNQITVTHAVGGITLATPQNIHTGASPTFAGLTLSGLTASTLIFANGSKALTSLGLMDGQLAVGVTGGNPVAANLTAGSGISITNGAGSITIAATGGASRAYAARHG